MRRLRHLYRAPRIGARGSGMIEIIYFLYGVMAVMVFALTRKA